MLEPCDLLFGGGREKQRHSLSLSSLISVYFFLRQLRVLEKEFVARWEKMLDKFYGPEKKNEKGGDMKLQHVFVQAQMSVNQGEKQVKCNPLPIFHHFSRSRVFKCSIYSLSPPTFPHPL